MLAFSLYPTELYPLILHPSDPTEPVLVSKSKEDKEEAEGTVISKARLRSGMEIEFKAAHQLSGKRLVKAVLNAHAVWG